MHHAEHMSPWLSQLTHDRPRFHFEGNAETDVAIVGAGIAGISTAYYVLTHTSARVILLDAGRIAHGATGRNAGQLVSYFERSLKDMAEQYGLQMTINAQASVDGAWIQLEEIQKKCGLKTPISRCTGYSGFSTITQIIGHLEDISIRAKGGLYTEPMLLSIASSLLGEIPAKYHAHILEVPHSMILSLLKSNDPQYIALASSQKGCTNSAMLCEEIAAWMLEEYGNRLCIAEHAPVTEVILGASSAKIILQDERCVSAGRVVLCTNGFENFTIKNNAGSLVDPSFHAGISGRIGYMAGYLDASVQMASAVSYYQVRDGTSPYHYLTRRSYERHPEPLRGLLCIGGPERFLPDRAAYDTNASFPADISEELDRIIQTTCKDPPGTSARAFLWHGLMGYTPDGIRRIGFEPRNHVLLYNLGCNGVGILPSIYGGKRIAQLLEGIRLPPSIFDPR